MYALDFEYDGQYLSDYGFIVCDFNYSGGSVNADAGSKLTFDTVSRNGGKDYGLSSTQYDSCITSEFDICKNPDVYDDLEISNDEYRDLIRWLNRREFLKFQVINTDDTESATCYYNASFNIDKIKIREKLFGLHLTMETNKPFGYGQAVTYTWDISDTSENYLLYDISDEIGETYPDMEITINAEGDFSIYNDMTDCTMAINDCSVGEVITIHGSAQIIETSLSTHNIANDFNYNFFKIGNAINNRTNRITVTKACELKITYNPVIKDAP